ncbi:monocarboxylate transporter 9-like isoform X1 [Bactrocera tryoni]|uniref:monocarboxylate transporter 9-like isoform X1 n=1 Tax=Bactrocera tryoni TaxID=59916 RepID=UPI001A95ABC2|nr:monocarboxylate transporter 9-like isoform X1 [Bactrocera tryoni]
MVLEHPIVDTNNPNTREMRSNTTPVIPTVRCNPSYSQQDCIEVEFPRLSTSCDHAINERLLICCPIRVNDGNDRLTTTTSKETLTMFDSRNATRTSNRLISNESADSIGSNSIDKKTPAVPDGGYGWIIVIASLIVSLIADGLGFSFGLINSELLNYFGESASKTAWISSLFFSVPLLMGPIWSNLVDKYGCRKMTIFGGFLSAVGFGLSSLCNSVEMLMLTFGIISGLGLGIGYVTAVVSIAFWFDKKRTFATGIAASGTGIGTLLYAPLTQWLIDSYGWRIATLILAGTMLNTCICGALMRAPDWINGEKKLEKETRSQSLPTSPISIINHKENPTKQTLNDMILTKSNANLRKEIHDTNYMKRLYSEMLIPTFLGSQNLDHECKVSSLYPHLSQRFRDDMKSSSHGNMPSLTSHGPKKTAVIIESQINALMGDITETTIEVEQLNIESIDAEYNKQLSNETARRLNNNGSSLILEDNVKNLTNCTNILKLENDVFKDSKHYVEAHSPPMKLISRLNLRQTSSIPSANLQKNMRIHNNISRDRSTTLKPYFRRTTSCPNIFRHSTAVHAKVKEDTWYEYAVGAMKSTFNFSLFADAKFTLFNLSILFLFIWFMIPYLYLPEHMKIHGYEAVDSAHMISVIGIAQTIGMIGLGYVGDRSWMNVNICYSACMVVCGIAVLLMPLVVNTYVGLLLACIAFGFTFASSYSLTPSICVRIVNLEDFTRAYGLVLLVQGVGMIVGPPIAGAIFEMTLRWDDAFYFAGAFIVLSGAASYLIEFCDKGEKVRSSDVSEI